MISNHQQSGSPIKTSTQKPNFSYACYRCNKPGHFIKDCPETTPKRSPISRPSSSSYTTFDPQFPPTHCRCGAGLCDIWISKSPRNPDRKYYRCPGSYDKNCGYFKWCDKLRKDEILSSQPEFDFPICTCGAGVCTVRVEEGGPDRGRTYFACPIKKGDGACNFRQWIDDSPHSALIIPDDAAAEQNILLDEFDLSYEEAMQVDAHEQGAHEPPLEPVQIQIEGSEGDKITDKSDEPSTESHPHPVQSNASQSNFDSEMTAQTTVDDDSAMENTQVSVAAVALNLHDSVAQDPSIEMLLQFLKGYLFQKSGSPGRVVGTPQRVPISAISPVIAGTFAYFDQVAMHKDNVSTPSVILDYSSEEGFEASPNLDEQPWSGLLLNPSGLLRDGLYEGSSMSDIVLQAFENLAHHIRNKLIALLDSMDPRDHEIMSKEADCTFAALDHLQIDYGLFRTRVTEYITHATSLSHIEQANDDDTTLKELLKHYCVEKSRYDEVWAAYRNANDAYKASSKKLSPLRTNASYFRDLVGDLETEVACYEVENARHRDSLHEISKTLSECKDNVYAAHQKASDALKQHEKREIQRSAAKAAFEKARAQLWK